MMDEVGWFRDQQCASHLLTELNGQRNLGVECNFTLSNGTTKRRVHRCVIRSFSPTINSFCDSKHTPCDQFTLEGISADTLNSVVEYIYTSDLKITQENVWELLLSGRQLSNEFIKQSCLTCLCTIITPENCIEILQRSMLDDLKVLRDKCIQTAIHNFDVVSRHAEFVNMAFEDLFTIVSHSGLVVKSEEDLLASIQKWIQHDKEIREAHAKRLGGTIRFQLFDAHSLLNLLHCEEYKAYQEPIEQAFLKFADISKDVILKEWARKTTTYTELCEKNQSADLPPVYGEHNAVKDIWILGGGSKAKGQCRNILWYKVELTSASTDCGENGQSTSTLPLTITEISDGLGTPNLQLPRSRKGFGAEQMKGQVFLIGGHPSKINKTVDVLDLQTGVWLIGPELNEGRSWNATTTSENCIFVVGGSNTSGKPLKCSEFLDIRTPTWQALPPMSTSRISLGLCAIDSCLFAVGGVNTASVEAFDQQAWSWRIINGLSDVREAPAVVQYAENVYTIGGADKKGCSSKVEKYSLEKGKWKEMTKMMNARAFAALATAEDYAIVFGGRNALEASADIQLYNMTTDSWSLSSVTLPEPRSSCRAVVLDIP